MNLFGIGEIELLLILIIALVVAGPKRMIQWAYLMGRFFAYVRSLWAEAVVVIQKEMDDAGLDVKVPTHIPTRGEVHNIASQVLKPLADPVQESLDEVKHVGTELNTTVDQARHALNTTPAKLPLKTSLTSPQPDALNEAKADDSSFGTWSLPQQEEQSN